tara:strand:- start:3637 stop:4299 length:663 start_codon:yes stop_codon:yes gene_type:complete
MTKDLNNVETFLEEAVLFLKKDNISLCEQSDDGRVNSSIDEDIVLGKLKGKFPKQVTVMPPRSWCDFVHTPTGTPVNFKSSSLAGSDNSCNFLTILHCFTDVKISSSRKPNKTKDIKDLFDWIKTNKAEIEKEKLNIKRDYYFLIINKKDTKDLFYTSIKQLEEISVNPSNLPFQVNWGKNRNKKSRTFKQAFEFCMHAIKSGIKKQYENSGYVRAMELL